MIIPIPLMEKGLISEKGFLSETGGLQKFFCLLRPYSLEQGNFCQKGKKILKKIGEI